MPLVLRKYKYACVLDGNKITFDKIMYVFNCLFFSNFGVTDIIDLTDHYIANIKNSVCVCVYGGRSGVEEGAGFFRYFLASVLRDSMCLESILLWYNSLIL